MRHTLRMDPSVQLSTNPLLGAARTATAAGADHTNGADAADVPHAPAGIRQLEPSVITVQPPPAFLPLLPTFTPPSSVLATHLVHPVVAPSRRRPTALPTTSFAAATATAPAAPAATATAATPNPSLVPAPMMTTTVATTTNPCRSLLCSPRDPTLSSATILSSTPRASRHRTAHSIHSLHFFVKWRPRSSPSTRSHFWLAEGHNSSTSTTTSSSTSSSTRPALLVFASLPSPSLDNKVGARSRRRRNSSRKKGTSHVPPTVTTTQQTPNITAAAAAVAAAAAAQAASLSSRTPATSSTNVGPRGPFIRRTLGNPLQTFPRAHSQVQFASHAAAMEAAGNSSNPPLVTPYEDAEFSTTLPQAENSCDSYLASSNCPALVLNADFQPLSYMPLSLWPWQEVVKAVYSNRVNIVATYDISVRSPSVIFPLPSVISLKHYQKNSHKPPFSRFNLFLRDSFSCQYCGTRLPTTELTFDHIVPRCLGGKTSWNNVVAACCFCNHKKGRRLLKDIPDLRLIKQPIEPSSSMLQSAARKFPPRVNLHESWRDYLYWNESMSDDN